jgi:hypothetical protein
MIHMVRKGQARYAYNPTEPGNFLSFFKRPVAAGLGIVTIGIWIVVLFVSLKHKDE